MSEKRKRGDRADGRLIGKLDSMHAFMPYMLPGRVANEAVMNELVDMTAVLEYLEKKNADSPEFKYTIFHVVCAAVAKTIAKRPKLNYYIMNYRYYERNEVSLAFTVKKRFDDNSPEGLAILHLDPNSEESPIDQVYGKVKKIVYAVRKENKNDGATDIMDVIMKFPRFIVKIITAILFFLDNHNMLPYDIRKEDPYHCSVFLSNLGSIKTTATYHHLANWGTNSFFAIVGEMKMQPFYNDDGTFEMRYALPLGLTIDERIADGFYFANSLKLLKKLLSEPELLERPLNEDIEY